MIDQVRTNCLFLLQLITDGVLAAVISTLLVADLIILTTWVLLDPLKIISIQLTPIVSRVNDGSAARDLLSIVLKFCLHQAQVPF